MYSLDIWIQDYISQSRTPLLTDIFYFFTKLFDVSIFFFVILTCVFLAIYKWKGRDYAILFFSAISIGAISVYLLKSYFNIDRPLEGVLLVHGKSFPSFHATISTIFSFMFVYIWRGIFGKVGRPIFTLSFILIALTVSFSRIYLGVHWLSDVLTGVVLGVFVSFACIEVFKRLTRRT